MKSTNRSIAFVITVVAAVVFVGTLVHALWFAPQSDLPPPGLSEAELIARENVPVEDEPVRFEIPSLGIDTDVQHVGVDAKGNMGVPSNFSDVAWYKYGTVPGYRGSAVIDGHVDNGLGLAGVFKRLGELERGDEIFVTTKGGERLRFMVEETQLYGYKSVPLARLFERTDRARLNLVTCDGSWIKSEKTYDQRFVVYAVLAPDS